MVPLFAFAEACLSDSCCADSHDRRLSARFRVSSFETVSRKAWGALIESDPNTDEVIFDNLGKMVAFALAFLSRKQCI